MDEYWNDHLPLKLRAAAVFQGGGIRGLFFPGHMAGLRNKGIKKIIVYAGSSAGALVATGLWAGLKPGELRDFLKAKSKRHSLALALFSPGDILQLIFSWVIFIAVIIPLNIAIFLLNAALNLVVWLLNAALRGFVWLLNKLLNAALRALVWLTNSVLWMLVTVLNYALDGLIKLLNLVMVAIEVVLASIGVKGIELERIGLEKIGLDRIGSKTMELERIRPKKIDLKKIQRKTIKPLEFRPGCNGERFENLINSLIIEGLGKRGISRKVIADVTGKEADNAHLTFKDIWDIVGWIEFVNDIDSDEHKNFGVIKKVYPELHNRVVFSRADDSSNSNIFELRYGKQVAEKLQLVPNFVPIFIAACCVENRSPFIFNNFEKEYWQVPIAATVRASAGHPIVFKPKVIRGKQYIDGGLMINFPVYSVYKAIRDRFIFTEELSYLPKDYYPLARRCFVTIGLSVSDDEHGGGRYIKTIFGILFGGARNLLERELASTCPNFRLLHQHVRDQPYHLNFLAVTPTLIERTYASAQEHCKGIALSTTTNIGSAPKAAILKNMRAMMGEIDRAFDRSSAGYLRCHLFFEDAERAGVLKRKAVICDGRAKGSFADIELPLEESTGLVGLVRQKTRPVICRIDILQQRRKNRRRHHVLGIRYGDAPDIPDDLNFSLVLPIFDVTTTSYKAGETGLSAEDEVADCVRVFDTGVTGAIIGLVSVDGALGFECGDIGAIGEHLRSRGTVETMERHALEIGHFIYSEIKKTLDTRSGEA